MTARSVRGLQAIAFCAAALSGPVRPSAQGTSTTSAVAAGDDALAAAVRDTIAARLAALEVLRARLRATGKMPSHPDRVSVDRQVELLRQQLHTLPMPETAEAYANVVVLRAIEGRLASVAVSRPLLEAERGATHPDVQALVAEERELQQRRSELRRARR